MTKLLKENLFTLLTKFLVIVLPFYVILAVFFSVQIWIPKAGFLFKELILVLLFVSLIYEFYKNKIRPKFDLLDYLIFAYFGYGIIISFINGLWLSSIVYGGRYDFVFFIVFLIYRHGKLFLQVSYNGLLKLFLLSATASLLCSILIKFRLWEKYLLIFWFTDYISNWTFDGRVPNYHGLENSGIKRFQWIFDGPNQMAFFLIVYTSILMQYVKKKFEYHMVLILIALFILVIMTYSRSAILGIFSWIWLLLLLNIKEIYKRFKKILIGGLIGCLIAWWGMLLIFGDKVENIVLRSSSTTGHFDRMAIWIDRFLEKPFWAWLAEAGPAFRSIYPDKQTKQDEQYYIPESWFIQQLIEGGFIYFILFVTILTLIAKKLYRYSKPLFVWMIAVLVMNVFLHIFEATYLSILLFLFIALFINIVPHKNIAKQ